MEEARGAYLQPVYAARLKDRDHTGRKPLRSRLQYRRVIAGPTDGRVGALVELSPDDFPMYAPDPDWQGSAGSEESVGKSGRISAQYGRIVLHRSPTHLPGRDTRPEAAHVQSHCAFSRFDARICRGSKSLRAANVDRA